MSSRLAPPLGCLLLLVGCASPPPPQPQYAQTADMLQIAAGAGEVAAPATLPADPALNGPHEVDFYVLRALEQNPRILAAQQQVSAEAMVIPQAVALDDPMLTDTFWPISDHAVQTAAGRLTNQVNVSQKLPWLGKLRLRGEVAEQDVKIALTQLAEAQLEVIEEVKLTYYELYYHQQAVKLTRESRELMAKIAEAAEARIPVGGSQQDALRAQLEIDRIENQLFELRRELRLAQVDLASLLHASPEALPAALTDVQIGAAPEEIDRLYELAVECRPELQERLHTIVREQRRRDLAAMQYIPDVTFGVGWTGVTESDAISPVANGHDNMQFSLGVNLPLWKDKLRAGVREAEHRVVQNARLYDAARDDAFRQIRRLIAQAESLERQRELYEESMLPRAEQTLEVSVAEWSAPGQNQANVDFLQVYNNWRELLALRMQLVRIEATLAQTLASLERAIGCQLAAAPESAAPSPRRLPPAEEVPAPR